MIDLHRWGVTVTLKVYVVAALTVATVLAPLSFSFVPLLLLGWYLYLWRWPVRVVIQLLTEYFMLFAIALLLSPQVGPLLSVLVALPVLLLINHNLKVAAELPIHLDSGHVRRPTSLSVTLLSITIAVLGISLLTGNVALLLSCAAVISYFGILGVSIIRGLPVKPVEETQIEQRMVVGAEDHFDVELTLKTKIGGLVYLTSSYEWLRVDPGTLSLKGNRLLVRVSIIPQLSGPSVIKLKGHATDLWGLTQICFELEPIRLHVIPKAKYASWLARRYLAGTKPGALPLITHVEALKPIHGLRSGVEYYGSQFYQPGDSLKNIDWKHSLKYNELITKEFTEFHGQSAIVLINLAVGNAEEADKLAHDIIVTAISLARENIPTALATYDHEGVKITTATLSPRQLLLHSLRVAQQMVIFVNPMKYLNPPDVARLRANISRISSAEGTAPKDWNTRISVTLQDTIQLPRRSLRDWRRQADNPI
jgi:hypothetical protein